MGAVDWHSFPLERLTRELQRDANAEAAGKLAWAFEEAVRAARIDDELLGYLLVAVVCLLARLEGVTPRDVLEAFFRRSITDDEWREKYLRLFA